MNKIVQNNRSVKDGIGKRLANGSCVVYLLMQWF